MKDLITKDKYKKEFEDFTFFENYYSNSPSSIPSMSFELIGNSFNQFDRIDTNKKLIKYVKDDQNNFINNKKLSKNILSYYKAYTDDETSINYDIKRLDHVILIVLEKYIRQTFVRIFTYKFDNILRVASSNNIQSMVYFDQYKTYLQKISKSRRIDQTNLHASFWDFTHEPINFDQNCKKLDKIEISKFQNYKGNVKISECSIKLIIEFIKVLKDNKLYQNSVIIFKSDHGNSTKYFKDDDVRTLSYLDSIFGYGRYQPFLLIKKNISNRFQLNNSIILNTDIASFVCNLYNNEKDCSKYGINNIDNAISKNIIIKNRVETFFIDEGKNRWEIENLKKYKINLNQDIEQKELKNIFLK